MDAVADQDRPDLRNCLRGQSDRAAGWGIRTGADRFDHRMHRAGDHLEHHHRKPQAAAAAIVNCVPGKVRLAGGTGTGAGISKNNEKDLNFPNIS